MRRGLAFTAAPVPMQRIGVTGGEALVLNDVPVPLARLRAVHEEALPALLAG